MYRAIAFDLLTALLDSWTLWESVAGSGERGLAWRKVYLDLTYGAGTYRPYEDVVRESALRSGLDAVCADELTERWDELQPWPGVIDGLRKLREQYRLAVVTNCSEQLGRRAARIAGEFDVVVTSERAGFYKPAPQPYRLMLAELGLAAADTLFVAGSAYDIAGANAVGMPVFWHNHIGLPLRAGPQPAAESREFQGLLDYVSGV